MFYLLTYLRVVFYGLVDIAVIGMCFCMSYNEVRKFTKKIVKAQHGSMISKRPMCCVAQPAVYSNISIL